MNLLVLGATGRTGRLVVEKALLHGHAVTAFVRTPSFQERERLTIVTGNPRRIDDLSQMLPGHDAVISCLGNPAPAARWLVSESASAMLTVMKAASIKRYVVQSGALLFPSINPAIVVMRMMMTNKLADARAMEDMVSASDVDWTIVRPPHLKEGVTPVGYQTKAWERPNRSWASLQFTDLADFLLEAVERRLFIRQTVGIAPA